MTTAAPAVAAPAAEPQALGPILPVRSFPLIAIVLTGLVVVIAGNWEWGLTFYHVVGGALWTSIDLFVGFVIGPILRSMPPFPALEGPISFGKNGDALKPVYIIEMQDGKWNLIGTHASGS